VIHEDYDEASNEFSYFQERKDGSRVKAKPFHFLYLEVTDNMTVDECEVIIPRMIKSIEPAHVEGYINKAIETDYEDRGYYMSRLTEGDFTKENVSRFRIDLHPVPHPV